MIQQQPESESKIYVFTQLNCKKAAAAEFKRWCLMLRTCIQLLKLQANRLILITVRAGVEVYVKDRQYDYHTTP